MKEILKGFLQPAADIIVLIAKKSPTDEIALQWIFFGLMLDDWLKDKGIYLD